MGAQKSPGDCSRRLHSDVTSEKTRNCSNLIGEIMIDAVMWEFLLMFLILGAMHAVFGVLYGVILHLGCEDGERAHEKDVSELLSVAKSWVSAYIVILGGEALVLVYSIPPVDADIRRYISYFVTVILMAVIYGSLPSLVAYATDRVLHIMRCWYRRIRGTR